MKHISLILVTLFTAACTNSAPNVTGAWTQPISIAPTDAQGVHLYSDGTAKSINMATLLYKTWHQSGNTVHITGDSIGNGQTIEFTDIFKYTISLNGDTQLINTTNPAMIYTRTTTE